MSENTQESRQYPLEGREAKEEEIRRREKEHFALKDKKRADDQRRTEEQIREKSARRGANQREWVKDHLDLNSQISRDEARAARKKSNESLALGVAESRARRDLDRINKPLNDRSKNHLGLGDRPDSLKKTFETPLKPSLGDVPRPTSK